MLTEASRCCGESPHNNAAAATNLGDSVLKAFAKDGACHFCKKPGHFKKDCSKYKEWASRKNVGHNMVSKSDKVNIVEEGSAKKDFLFTSRGNREGQYNWVLDSGATKHVSICKHYFTRLNESYKGTVELANGDEVNVQGVSTLEIKLLTESCSISKFNLDEVLFAPNVNCNLLSVGKLAKSGLR